MKYALLATVALSAASLATPRAATAQTLAVRVTAVDDLPTSGGLTHALGSADCGDSVPIDLEIGNVPATGSQLDFWRGSNCIDPAARGRTTGTPTCTYLTAPSGPIASRPVDHRSRVPLQSLVGTCPTSGSPTYAIYVLVTGAAMSTEPVTSYGVLTITLDADAPGAPINLTSTPRGTYAHLTWMDIADADSFNVFTDSSVGTDCASTALVAGADAPSTPPAISPPGTARSAELAGPAIGAHMAVALVAVDPAGNQSKLSNVVCITGEPPLDASVTTMLDGSVAASDDGSVTPMLDGSVPADDGSLGDAAVTPHDATVTPHDAAPTVGADSSDLPPAPHGCACDLGHRHEGSNHEAVWMLTVATLAFVALRERRTRTHRMRRRGGLDA